MKKIFWPLLAFFALSAAALRVGNLKTGFEGSRYGLPIAGNLYAYLLPAVLLAAALTFALLFRSCAPRRSETRCMADCFDFSGTPSVLTAVLGAFGLMGYAALLMLLYGSQAFMALLGVGYFASGAAVLYTVFRLRRREEMLGSVLIMPVCTLVLQLVFTYRSCANDPTLGHTYIEILTLCALMLVFLELAAFVFRDGSVRLFAPLCALSVVLCTCRLAECVTLPARLFALSFLLLTLALCMAIHSEQK